MEKKRKWGGWGEKKRLGLGIAGIGAAKLVLEKWAREEIRVRHLWNWEGLGINRASIAASNAGTVGRRAEEEEEEEGFQRFSGKW